MKIEKIKNYNQKMLAVLSTILVTMALIGLVSIIVVLIGELIPHSPPTHVLLANEEVEELKKDNLRKQIISYSPPQLVDTNKLIYIIPVGVKTLKKAESVIEAMSYSASMEANYEPEGKRKYPSKRYYGTFNNLVVYNYISGISHKIFNSRFAGYNMSYEYFDDEIIIVCKGSETGDDKRITGKYFSSLFVYSLNKRELKKITMPHATVQSFEYVNNKKDILITFGIDRNKDNEFDSETEPTIIMKYDYEKDSLSHLVSNKLEADIQKIIDKI